MIFKFPSSHSFFRTFFDHSLDIHAPSHFHNHGGTAVFIKALKSFHYSLLLIYPLENPWENIIHLFSRSSCYSQGFENIENFTRAKSIFCCFVSKSTACNKLHLSTFQLYSDTFMDSRWKLNNVFHNIKHIFYIKIEKTTFFDTSRCYKLQECCNVGFS